MYIRSAVYIVVVELSLYIYTYACIGTLILSATLLGGKRYDSHVYVERVVVFIRTTFQRYI